MNFRFKLEPYKGNKTRYTCPQCNARKSFTLYIDTETGEYVDSMVGKCNRIVKCGYHYGPKQFFKDNEYAFDRLTVPRSIEQKLLPTSFVPVDSFKASLTRYERNNFVKFLVSVFGNKVTQEAIRRYLIGTSKHWSGSTIFWQIDQHGRVRTGKIMLYDYKTGKRVKKPFSHIYWVHKVLYPQYFVLEQCLFGEHLLLDDSKTVALVESEKTAIIASVYFPEFIWLAVGSLTNLNERKCRILKGRNVILFPDLNGYEKWSTKARELSHIANFVVSDLFETKSVEIEKKLGFDLADYLLKFKITEFSKKKDLEVK